jgi:Uma2 family endonuclease
MPVLINDPLMEVKFRSDREECDSSRWDEVWEGVLVVPPIPNDDHQDLVGKIYLALFDVSQKTKKGLVRPGVNVTDRHPGWKDNYRVPDVVVYLFTNPAINHGSHWTGGPDFLVEVLSPGERAYAKFDFYAKVRTQEIMLVFRNPWSLELHRLEGDSFRLVGRNELGDASVLSSDAIPLSFHLTPSATRPTIEMRHTEDGRVWEG